MDILIGIFQKWLPTVITTLFFYVTYVLVKKLKQRQAKGHKDKSRLRRSFRPGDLLLSMTCLAELLNKDCFILKIQTLDRDLTSMPNMHLASSAVKVTGFSGSIIIDKIETKVEELDNKE